MKKFTNSRYTKKPNTDSELYVINDNAIDESELMNLVKQTTSKTRKSNYSWHKTNKYLVNNNDRKISKLFTNINDTCNENNRNDTDIGKATVTTPIATSVAVTSTTLNYTNNDDDDDGGNVVDEYGNEEDEQSDEEICLKKMRTMEDETWTRRNEVDSLTEQNEIENENIRMNPPKLLLKTISENDHYSSNEYTSSINKFSEHEKNLARTIFEQSKDSCEKFQLINQELKKKYNFRKFVNPNDMIEYAFSYLIGTEIKVELEIIEWCEMVFILLATNYVFSKTTNIINCAFINNYIGKTKYPYMLEYLKYQYVLNEEAINIFNDSVIDIYNNNLPNPNEFPDRSKKNKEKLKNFNPLKSNSRGETKRQFSQLTGTDKVKLDNLALVYLWDAKFNFIIRTINKTQWQHCTIDKVFNSKIKAYGFVNLTAFLEYTHNYKIRIFKEQIEKQFEAEKGVYKILENYRKKLFYTKPVVDVYLLKKFHVIPEHLERFHQQISNK